MKRDFKLSERKHQINRRKAVEMLELYMADAEQLKQDRLTDLEAQYHLSVVLNETIQAWVKHRISLGDMNVAQSIEQFADFISEVSLADLGEDPSVQDCLKKEFMEEAKVEVKH